MKAIPNKVIIGDESNPILTFYNDAIKSVTEETAVSPVGDELFIDQFVPIVKYGLLIQYIISPADEEYNSIRSADGYIICSRYNYDIRNIPYGTSRIPRNEYLRLMTNTDELANDVGTTCPAFICSFSSKSAKSIPSSSIFTPTKLAPLLILSKDSYGKDPCPPVDKEH